MSCRAQGQDSAILDFSGMQLSVTKPNGASDVFQNRRYVEENIIFCKGNVKHLIAPQCEMR